MSLVARPALRPDWQAWYAERLVSAEQAAAQIRSGEHLYIPVGMQTRSVVAALLARRAGLSEVRITCMPVGDLGWFAPELAGAIEISVIHANPVSHEALARRTADYTPFMIYGAHRAIDENREEARPIDTAIITVSPPNEQGYVCLGNAVWDAGSVVPRARRVIATVNQHLPRTFGDSWLPVSAIDWFVEDHTAPQPRAYPDPDPWDAAIAGYAGSIVHDRDTIQIGVGSTTGNLVRLGGLNGKHDLGYFGELTVPGTVDLAREGVITGRCMTTHPHKFVTTAAGNSPEDVAFIDGNPAFEFRAVDYLHDPRSIAANDNYVAINNALAVDLTGQIAASTIGPRIFSGTGGQLAFAIGAFMSRGGRYVVVLPSTARGGTVSRIAPQFDAGQIVTVPRDLADIVVTEYGIARLLNRSVRERAEALIAIAHPDHRSELRQAAARLFWP
ncbi:MAG TPA: acetyl-CoA hydrolase/transferase C-terminal domain-containing protein [Dehalococcoidia bacterium]|nr:acetyl-CoA hydrolase/transferase C-terminal domain-containing protein [Dehalococcoidia bacterium]